MKTKELLLAAMFAALTGVCAQIAIPTPFSPIPITLQVLSVFLSGVILGGRLSFISLSVYLLLGAMGAPVFSNGTGGFQILVGVTGGYLISYPIASYLMGKVSILASKRSIKTQFVTNGLSMLSGLMVIYLIGSVQFAVLTGNTMVGALKMTVIPFIMPDLIKLGIALPLATTVKSRLVQAKLIEV